MKRNYIFSFVLVYIFGILTTFAQDLKLQAGLGRTVMKQIYNIENTADNIYPAWGFHFGPLVEFKLSERFSVKTGAFLQIKGFNENYSFTVADSPVSDKTRVKFWYIDFPLQLRMRFKLGTQAFFSELGPYAGITANANFHRITEWGDSTDDVTGKIPIGKINDDWGIKKRGAYGLLFSAGTKIKSTEIGVSFDLGLTNCTFQHDRALGYDLYHRVVSIYAVFPIINL